MKDLRLIAMYLPQFHRVMENDLWWGEGFTEWTAVKKARPLFDGHEQPKIPFKKNYYDLAKKQTMLWQTELMHKFRIDAMCFYHYYFENGKRMLEKPAENLLKWKEIDMPFCFSWANETWARTWSNLSNGNAWNAIEEEEQRCERNESDGILLRQNYGDEGEWEQHFLYLLPFFKDERYLRIENRPVFLIYKLEDIPCFIQMKEKWNSLAEREGLENIYFIGTNIESSAVDATVIQQPQRVFMQMGVGNAKNIEHLKQYGNTDYEDICRKSLYEMQYEQGNIYFSVFPGYDDTPRRGAHGVAITNSRADIFEKYLRGAIHLSRKRGNEILFINAWNEWGEGMYLEPDEKNRYQYLEAVKNAVDYPEGELLDISTLKHQDEKEAYQKRIEQYRSYWKTLDLWMTIKENGRSISEYLENNPIKKLLFMGLACLDSICWQI